MNNLNKKSAIGVSGHSLEDLIKFHDASKDYFASELIMLKDVIPRISEERQLKAALLLMSCTRTGAAILQLANQTNSFNTEAMMLARAFIEKIINFNYVSICEEKEYRAFILHPIYKQYHNVGAIDIHDVEFDGDFQFNNQRMLERIKIRKEKQNRLKSLPIVNEALGIFSETRSNMKWSKITLDERIKIIAEWGKSMDVFFYLSKLQYYSDASEAIHGSLYGCTYSIGAFDPAFDRKREGEINKKIYKDSACNLLYLGMLIHETLTLISYSANIKEIWETSYYNRSRALNLLLLIIEKETHYLKNK